MAELKLLCLLPAILLLLLPSSVSCGPEDNSDGYARIGAGGGTNSSISQGLAPVRAALSAARFTTHGIMFIALVLAASALVIFLSRSREEN